MQQHQAQQQHYWRHFPRNRSASSSSWTTAVAGRLWVDPRPDRLHVLDITLLPALPQASGLGTRCLQALALAGPTAAACALGIQVEIHNPARRLYERLGFVSQTAGPQGLYQAMLSPAPAPQTEECLP